MMTRTEEERQAPVYAAALEHVRLCPGERVLDLGCGAGGFLRLCADRGAETHGVEPAEPLLARARERVPEAELRHGDLEALPYPDGAFDLVTGFTTFLLAEDTVAAVREAGRVARPGACVVVEVSGEPEREEAALARLRAGEPRSSYWRPGVAVELVSAAGLAVERAFNLTRNAGEWHMVIARA